MVLQARYDYGGIRMAEFEYANYEVEGKKLKDYLKSDQGLVDYEKCEFGKNVSKQKGIIIYDMGEFEHDPEVAETTYFNGVDMARVVAGLKYGVPYKGMRLYDALEGDSYVRNFAMWYTELSVEDYVLYFFRLLDGDVYISETNYHVFVKGRTSEEEEWKEAVNKLLSHRRSESKQ